MDISSRISCTCGMVRDTIGLDSGQAVFQLGHYSLAILLIGAAGAMDHHGAGGQFFVTAALGFGLFAKAYDSGYPTVASQLGIVVGLLVLLRPSSSRVAHTQEDSYLQFHVWH